MARRGPRPIPRPADSRTPCHECPKVPQRVKDVKGHDCTPADALEPGDMHWAAVEQFLKYDAVRAFPDDDWVAENAAVIRPVKDAADAAPLASVMNLIAIGMLKKR